MSFENYLYVALLWTAACALPGAVLALREAVIRWRERGSLEHPKTETAGTAALVAAGILFHAIEELLYKSGRIWQFMQGKDTYGSADGILIAAGLCGIVSLTLAVHYLNRRSWAIPVVFWFGHATLLWLLI